LHNLINATLSELRGRLQKDAVYGEHAPGVDLAILCIDIDTCIMEWSSLNINLILIDELNKSETLCKAKGFLNLPNFEDKVHHGVCDIKGKRVAMFSDGIYDQLGGENGKRLKLSGLHQMIENGDVFSNGICMIESCLRQWKGNNDQTDDCMWISFEA
jgi:serine phosphatase RsbU (regulator of sigma subunit)